VQIYIQILNPPKIDCFFFKGTIFISQLTGLRFFLVLFDAAKKIKQDLMFYSPLSKITALRIMHSIFAALQYRLNSNFYC
jgi:hypothetical protein